MNFEMSDEQEELREAARRFARAELPAIAADLEARNVPPSRELVRLYAEMGFLGINVDKQYGGLGLDNLSALIVLEEFAKISSAVAFPIFESSVGPVRAIEKFAGDDLKRRVIPGVCRGA
jgi:alkylation response protein AidB-like acyl-CoA dehydrogenase